MTAQECLAELLRSVKRIEAHLGIRPDGHPAQAPVGGRYAVPAGAVADDAELDSAKGDPTIRRDPPRWKGQPYVGARYSETEPQYLEVMAEFCEFKAANPRAGADPKYVGYDLKDAARARGHAKRMRERERGHAPRPEATQVRAADFGFDDGAGGTEDSAEAAYDNDIPFVTVASGSRERWHR